MQNYLTQTHEKTYKTTIFQPMNSKSAIADSDR